MHSPSGAAPLDAAVPAHALWNPVAAACWSVVFTPAFGAWVLMRNWEALGEPRLAASARTWFAWSLALLGVRLLASALGERLNSQPTLVYWTALLFLASWWCGAALPQARAIRARYGDQYLRRGWDQALLVAALAGFGYYLAGAGLTWLFVTVT